MTRYMIPYGHEKLNVDLPDDLPVEWITPAEAPPAADPLQTVAEALDHPVGARTLADFRAARSAAIAINDKTRPVPHEHLLPPLLARLEAFGLPPDAITLIVATGTHDPMPREEFSRILPAEVLARYPVICHDCDDRASLVYKGTTTRGTPVWINRHYDAAELRLVIGNIEAHQFVGFSGGVKSAAIGLAGRETISRNHTLMTHADAQLGRYAGNPAREDVEEIGARVRVDFALNAILNHEKRIVRALAGEPLAVMQAGVPLVTSLYSVAVRAPLDVAITSPGGHPKDINLYQAQKALAHAALITRPGGTIILVAACPEGTGSAHYEEWMQGVESYQAVFERFAAEGFRIGPHKAYQIARDASQARVYLVSQMPPEQVRGLLLHPAAPDEIARLATARLPAGGQLGVLPIANATVPRLA